MEKFCPLCGRVYGEEAVLCEVDDERLVILREEPSLVGHQLDGKHHLIAKLGEGGMGSVYLANQKTMGREVAIKVLRREFSQNRLAIKRFLREARAASKLDHPNTITVYDFGQSDDGLLYLVMERLVGCSLADVLEESGPMPVKRAVHIMGQICDSLSEAHHHGITHRDLKPENIFILQKAGNPDFVKVLDFGIAKISGDDVTQATAAGMICGTPAYMSPEQAMGKDLDGRSDIYALGILMFEMLSDRKPYEGDTPMEVMLKHINEPVPDIFQRTAISVPEGIQDTIERMLSKRVDRRPKDCQDVKALLQAGLSTPLIGPVNVTGEVSAKRRTDTAERASALEKTGLSLAAAGPSGALNASGRSQSQSRASLSDGTRRGGMLRWVVLGAGVVAAIVLSIMLLASDSPRSGNQNISTTSGGAADIVDGDSHLSATSSPSLLPSPSASPSSGVEDVAGAIAAQPVRVSRAKGDTDQPVDSASAAAPNTMAQGVRDVTAGVDGDIAVAALGSDAAAADAVTTVQPEAPVEVPASLPAMVTITLTSRPAGAAVYEGRLRVGTTPLSLERPRDSGALVLVVRRRGYKDRRLTISTAGNLEKEFSLTRHRLKVKPAATRDVEEVGTF